MRYHRTTAADAVTRMVAHATGFAVECVARQTGMGRSTLYDQLKRSSIPEAPVWRFLDCTSASAMHLLHQGLREGRA